MKVLIFAHTPPPHHGQSYMVQLLVEGFGGDCRGRKGPFSRDVQLYHINARLSDSLHDLGGIHLCKILRLLWYCLEAIWCRFRYGVDILYYVPAPSKKSAIFRDWVVMACVRPWFRKTVFHWHASGLGHWATGSDEYPSVGEAAFVFPAPTIFGGRWEKMARALTRQLLRGADLAIVLTEYGRADAELLAARKVIVIPNGVPDFCPEFSEKILPDRRRRLASRRLAERADKGESILEVLFLTHCIAEKGVFDVLEIVARSRAAIPRIRLTVAGDFFEPEERVQFEERICQPDLAGIVRYVGFAKAEQKRSLLAHSDVLCFPTFFRNEALPTVIIEAMAYGLPIVTSKWRGLPGMFTEHSQSFLVEPKNIEEFSRALCVAAGTDIFVTQRENYLAKFELNAHLEKMTAAFRTLEA